MSGVRIEGHELTCSRFGSYTSDFGSKSRYCSKINTDGQSSLSPSPSNQPASPRQAPTRQPCSAWSQHRPYKHDKTRCTSTQYCSYGYVHPQSRRCRHRTVSTPWYRRVSKRTWSMCNRVKCDGIINLRLEGNATNRVEEICCLASFHAYGNWHLESQSPAVYIGLDFMALGFMVSQSSMR